MMGTRKTDRYILIFATGIALSVVAILHPIVWFIPWGLEEGGWRVAMLRWDLWDTAAAMRLHWVNLLTAAMLLGLWGWAIYENARTRD